MEGVPVGRIPFIRVSGSNGNSITHPDNSRQTPLADRITTTRSNSRTTNCIDRICQMLAEKGLMFAHLKYNRKTNKMTIGYSFNLPWISDKLREKNNTAITEFTSNRISQLGQSASVWHSGLSGLVDEIAQEHLSSSRQPCATNDSSQSIHSEGSMALAGAPSNSPVDNQSNYSSITDHSSEPTYYTSPPVPPTEEVEELHTSPPVPPTEEEEELHTSPPVPPTEEEEELHTSPPVPPTEEEEELHTSPPVPPTEEEEELHTSPPVPPTEAVVEPHTSPPVQPFFIPTSFIDARSNGVVEILYTKEKVQQDPAFCLKELVCKLPGKTIGSQKHSLLQIHSLTFAEYSKSGARGKGFDAGGLTQNALTLLTTSLKNKLVTADGTLYKPGDSGAPEGLDEIYKNLGELFTWVKSTDFLLGELFNPTVYEAICSMNTEEIQDPSQLEDSKLANLALKIPLSTQEKHQVDSFKEIAESVKKIVDDHKSSPFDPTHHNDTTLENLFLWGQGQVLEKTGDTLRNENSTELTSTDVEEAYNELRKNCVKIIEPVKMLANSLSLADPEWHTKTRQENAGQVLCEKIQGSFRRKDLVEKLRLDAREIEVPESALAKRLTSYKEFLESWIMDPNTPEKKIRNFLNNATASSMLPTHYLTLNIFKHTTPLDPPKWHTCPLFPLLQDIKKSGDENALVYTHRVEIPDHIHNQTEFDELFNRECDVAIEGHNEL